MTQTQVLVTIIGLLSTLCTILIGPAIKKYFFDTRMRLRVEIRVSRSKFKNLIVKKIKEAHAAKSSDKELQFLRYLGDESSYVELKLKNVSTKKITGVNVIMRNIFTGSYQNDDLEELNKATPDIPIVLGDISTKHERTLHLWFMNDLSEYSQKHLKQLFEISADELDAAAVKWPAPGYITDRFKDRVLMTISTIFFGVGACLVLYIIYTTQMKGG